MTAMVESAEPPSDGGGGSGPAFGFTAPHPSHIGHGHGHGHGYGLGNKRLLIDEACGHAYCSSNGVIREAGENPARPPPL